MRRIRRARRAYPRRQSSSCTAQSTSGRPHSLRGHWSARQCSSRRVASVSAGRREKAAATPETRHRAMMGPHCRSRLLLSSQAPPHEGRLAARRGVQRDSIAPAAPRCQQSRRIAKGPDEQVIVQARVSSTGNAIPQPGDWTAAPVTVELQGAPQAVAVEIDTQMP